MWIVIVSVVAVSLATSYAFRPEVGGTLSFWVSLGTVYLLLGALSLYELWRKGTWRVRLRPRAGDLSWGILVGLGLLLLSWAVRYVLAPAGTPAQSWLYRLYLQIGDPQILKRSTLYTAILLCLAVLEELVWRGAVLDAVKTRVGARWGFVVAAVLYGLAHAPTAYLLRDPVAGYNPLLVLAAVGCGLCWGFLTRMLGRLPPAIVSHMAFSYFSVFQLRLVGP